MHSNSHQGVCAAGEGKGQRNGNSGYSLPLLRPAILHSIPHAGFGFLETLSQVWLAWHPGTVAVCEILLLSLSPLPLISTSIGKLSLLAVRMTRHFYFFPPYVWGSCPKQKEAELELSFNCISAWLIFPVKYPHLAGILVCFRPARPPRPYFFFPGIQSHIYS